MHIYKSCYVTRYLIVGLEFGRGRVHSCNIHVHETTRLPTRQDHHPHNIQWPEASYPRCAQ